MSSSTSSIRSQRPGVVESEHELALLVHPERVLELVAVAQLLLRRHDRLNRRVLESADARERVANLGLLLLELALVRQHLPRRARVGRHRLDAVGARLQQLDQLGLRPRALRLSDPHAHAVTGNGAADEHDVSGLGARDPRPAIGETVNGHIELVAPSGTRACGCLGAFHDALWSQARSCKTAYEPSFDSIEFSTVLRFALRRS